QEAARRLRRGGRGGRRRPRGRQGTVAVHAREADLHGHRARRGAREGREGGEAFGGEVLLRDRVAESGDRGRVGIHRGGGVMRGLFKYTGWFEGLSYLLLLGVAMPIKYVWGDPSWVSAVGMAHGLLFLAYIGLAFALY